jgi:ATP-binding cassette, subfamily B, multidrug efflux pump
MSPREEKNFEKFHDVRVTRRLLRYLRPYRWQVALAVGVTLGVALMELVGPYLFHIAIDRYILPGFSRQMSVNVATRGLATVMLVFLIAILGNLFLQYAQVRCMQRIGQHTMYDLRKDIFEHLQHLPVHFFDHNPIGRLVTRATTDVDALSDLFASGVVAMVNDLVLLLFIAALLFQWHPLLALATFSPLPFMVLLTYAFRKRVRSAQSRIRIGIARINTFFYEQIGGMQVVQLFNRQEKAHHQFTELNRVLLQDYKTALGGWSFYYPAVDFFSWAGLAMLFWVGGLRVVDGTLELGILISFVVYAQRFFRPIEDVSDKIDVLQNAAAAAERVFELLDEPVMPVSATDTHAKYSGHGEIEFRNVWFAYQGGENPEERDWVLRNVSFRIEAGETIAIVGRTGAGKTTIIQLLLRFYDIQRGQILVEGVDIRTMDLQELRGRFGIVLQDAYLFTGTIESNVRLGRKHVDRAAVGQALRKVGLGSFLDSQPLGIETPVTERGSTLSMGQRQLVTLARALAHDPQFLVLDEATSSVDTQTEHMIRKALDQLRQGRTALIIAHRLSTIRQVHSILVFHKGHLREQGSHQDLLLKRGIYYRLYELQYKEQEHFSAPAAEFPRCVTAS